MVCEVWSLDHQLQHHQELVRNPYSWTLLQTSWIRNSRVGIGILTDLPGDSDAQSSLRTTAVNWKKSTSYEVKMNVGMKSLEKVRQFSFNQNGSIDGSYPKESGESGICFKSLFYWHQNVTVFCCWMICILWVILPAPNHKLGWVLISSPQQYFPDPPYSHSSSRPA